ncbi:MAG TPA: GNAT family N-acetyltransferase [Coriobacteriia bacterium]|nr:GNAT family N-acetyltransferase [Coriobacteriia bacterium]
MGTISGTLVTLRPSRETDRRAVFEWLAESDATSAMLGPPLFPEVPAPTWDEFNADYTPNLFDGSTPEVEASYIIEVAGEGIGQINYEVLDTPQRVAELDIWLRSLDDTGQGYGSDALLTLVGHIRRSLGVTTFLIRPSARNPRAIRAYEKAGFVQVPMSAEEQERLYGAGDYTDTVVMLRRLEGS